MGGIKKKGKKKRVEKITQNALQHQPQNNNNNNTTGNNIKDNFPQTPSHKIEDLSLSQPLSPDDILLQANIILEKKDISFFYDMPETSSLLTNAGVIYQKNKNFSKANQCYQGALKIELYQHGDKSKGLSEIYSNLGHLNTLEHNSNDAISYYKQCLEIDQLHFGHNSLKVAEVYNNLGINYKELGKWNNALHYYEQTLEIRNRIEPNTGIVSDVLKNIGNVHFRQGHLGKAKKAYEKALEMRVRFYGEGSLQVSDIYFRLGKTFAMQNLAEDALELFDKSLNTQCYFDESSLFVSEILQSKANVYLVQDKLQLATEALEKAIKIERAQKSSNNKELISDLQTRLSELYFKQGMYTKSIAASSSLVFSLRKN